MNDCKICRGEEPFVAIKTDAGLFNENLHVDADGGRFIIVHLAQYSERAYFNYCPNCGAPLSEKAKQDAEINEGRIANEAILKYEKMKQEEKGSDCHMDCGYCLCHNNMKCPKGYPVTFKPVKEDI